MNITKDDLLIIMVKKLTEVTNEISEKLDSDAEDNYLKIVDGLLGKEVNHNFITLLIEGSFKKIYTNIDNGYFDDKTFSEFCNDLQKIEYRINEYLLGITYVTEFIRDSNYEKKLKFYANEQELIDVIMKSDIDFSDELIQREIGKISYKDFLKTIYWKAIRKYKLDKANHKCSLCNNQKGLNVHHKTYDRHGLEHIITVADEDLIVLCKDCHAKFHDKLKN